MPTIAINKRAHFDYEILEEIEAGIVLTGAEVKAAKNGLMNLIGSYAAVTGQGAVLLNSAISPYSKAKGTQTDYDPRRSRQLLLRASELKKMLGQTGSSPLTIVPLSAYTKGGFIKIKLGIARGKQKRDQRESIKKRDAERRTRQATYRRR